MNFLNHHSIYFNISKLNYLNIVLAIESIYKIKAPYGAYFELKRVRAFQPTHDQSVSNPYFFHGFDDEP